MGLRDPEKAIHEVPLGHNLLFEQGMDMAENGITDQMTFGQCTEPALIENPPGCNSCCAWHGSMFDSRLGGFLCTGDIDLFFFLGLDPT
jgi:hypothetical protein